MLTTSAAEGGEGGVAEQSLLSLPMLPVKEIMLKATAHELLQLLLDAATRHAKAAVSGNDSDGDDDAAAGLAAVAAAQGQTVQTSMKRASQVAQVSFGRKLLLYEQRRLQGGLPCIGAKLPDAELEGRRRVRGAWALHPAERRLRVLRGAGLRGQGL